MVGGDLPVSLECKVAGFEQVNNGFPEIALGPGSKPRGRAKITLGVGEMNFFHKAKPKSIRTFGVAAERSAVSPTECAIGLVRSVFQ